MNVFPKRGSKSARRIVRRFPGAVSAAPSHRCVRKVIISSVFRAATFTRRYAKATVFLPTFTIESKQFFFSFFFNTRTITRVKLSKEIARNNKYRKWKVKGRRVDNKPAAFLLDAIPTEAGTNAAGQNRNRAVFPACREMRNISLHARIQRVPTYVLAEIAKVH
ncbi:hypothetical protein PUN28_007822 [Cardiocondyla obscurior]|uniref:Uncharacterized protein n=1 Tax=Cardiocondyla obscurior TaxID=286306 RepID=A0AAW2FUI3_9HYME